MSRPPSTPLAQMLRALDGARIPGGCDHCDAYQTVHADYHGPNIHRLTVHHDDWCPVLAQYEAAEQEAPR